jgi:hypothetical protein
MNARSRAKFYDACLADLDRNVHFRLFEIYGKDMRNLLMPGSSTTPRKFQHPITPLSRIKTIMEASLKDENNGNEDNSNQNQNQNQQKIDITMDKSCGVLMSKTLELFLLELTANSVILCHKNNQIQFENNEDNNNDDDGADEKLIVDERHVRDALKLPQFSLLSELQKDIDILDYQSELENNNNTIDNNDENNDFGMFFLLLFLFFKFTF